MPDMVVVAHTLVPPATLGSAFRKEVQAIDSDLPVNTPLTFEQRLDRNYWMFRVRAVLFLIFAAIALLLASVGLYALMAHSVNERTQEIGIRMAIGATASNILGLVFKKGLWQIAIRLGGALAVMRLVKAALVQVSPADPVTLAASSVVLVLAAALGCLIPARRAARVDPVVALCYE